jgi:hypothetical protein
MWLRLSVDVVGSVLSQTKMATLFSWLFIYETICIKSIGQLIDALITAQVITQVPFYFTSVILVLLTFFHGSLSLL